MKRKYKRRVVSFPVLSRPQNGNFYLGIMGAQLMAPLNPYDVGGVSGGPWCRETPFSRTTTPHSCFLTSKLNSKTIPVLPSLDSSPIFAFHILPSPVHPTGFFFCLFPDFLAIFTLLSPNNNNNNNNIVARVAIYFLSHSTLKVSNHNLTFIDILLLSL